MRIDGAEEPRRQGSGRNAADCGKSTFAPQALILRNGPLAAAQGKAFAVSLINGGDEKGWVDAAYRRCFGRPATAAEVRRLTAFLKTQSKLPVDRAAKGEDIGVPAGLPEGADPMRALADVCLALFNLNDFVHVR